MESLKIESDWRTMFAVERLEPEFEINVQCHCGSGRCSAAKKFRCTCSCGHKNHGSKYKGGLARLDQVLKEVE